MRRRRAAEHGGRPIRARWAALGAVAATAVAIVGITLGPSAAAAGPLDPAGTRVGAAGAGQAVGYVRGPSGTASTEVASDGTTLSLSVTPSMGLSAASGDVVLTVRGSGFDDSHELWVAICLNFDGVAPAALIHCVGGAIPDDNSTSAWATVTSDGNPSYPGPSGAKWQAGGSFEAGLAFPATLASQCAPQNCSVYTRSSQDDDRSQDASVPLDFAAAGQTTTPTTSKGTPTTEVIGGVPTTVGPEVLQSSSVEAGGEQTVLFAGFTPGEDVAVTLFSDPITLPNAQADGSGNVRITFTVPDDLPPGTHLIQAVGLGSNRVGVAQFTVTPIASSSTDASSTEISSAAPSTAEPTESAGVSFPPVTESFQEPSDVLSSSAPATDASTPAMSESSSAAIAPAGDDGAGARLRWLWIVLVILVLAAGAAGVIVMLRARRQREELPPPAVATVHDPHAPGDLPGWSASPYGGAGFASGSAAGGAEPDGGFGLLTGRDEHPDNVGLYGGGARQDTAGSVADPSDAPTSLIPEAPVTDPADPEPSTEQWRPDFTAEQPVDPGPSTEQWRPDFSGEGQPDPGEPRRGRHHHDD